MNDAPPIRRIRRSIVLVGLVAALALGCTPAAPALAGEVHFDPDSPAGKEYALPLPQARNEALGGEGIGGGGSPTQAPLFGVGIGGSGGPGGGSAGQGGQGGGASGTPSGSSQSQGGGEENGSTSRSGSKQSAGSNPSATTARVQAGEDASFGLGTAVGLVAAILVAALLLGLALRALSRAATSRALGRA